MNIKRLLLLSALLALSFFGTAQTTLEVESFNLLENDVTANTGINQKRQDGRVCALIRVKTKNKELLFSTGSIPIRETDYQKPGEIWVWVSAESRMLFISDEEENTLEYDFDGLQLQEARTYELVLKIKAAEEEVQPVVVPVVQLCTLDVTSDKKGDDVYINDSLVGQTPLTLQVPQEARYEVKVKRGDYEKAEPTFYINKFQTYKPVEFSFTKKIFIDSDKASHADIFVDGIDMNRKTGAEVDIEYGKHTIRVEHGKSYNEKDIVVEDDCDTWHMLELLTPQQHFTKKSISFATLNFGAGFLDMGEILSPKLYFQKSYGFSVGYVNRLGCFFTFMTNFDNTAFKADYVAEYNSNIEGGGNLVNGYYPFYTGESCSSRISVMGGLLVKMGRRSCLRLGAGYGHRAFAYAESGGKWVRPERFDRKGLDASIGLQFNNCNHTVVTFDWVTTSFSTIEARIAIGFCEQTTKLFKEKQ